MLKKLGFYFILVFMLTVSISSISFAGKPMSICEFPYWESNSGGLAVHYDARFWDKSDFPFSLPNGGIKFSLSLYNIDLPNGTLLTDKIKKVTYENLDKKIQVILTEGSIYSESDSLTVEYSIQLGSPNSVLGEWKITLTTKNNKEYYVMGTITQEMFNQTPPPLVENIEITSENEYFVVSFSAPFVPEYPNVYRFRVIDDYGNIAFQQNDCTYDSSTGKWKFTVLTSYTGFRARIETRFYNSLWPKLNCNGSGDGQYSRSMIWFKLP